MLQLCNISIQEHQFYHGIYSEILFNSLHKEYYNILILKLCKYLNTVKTFKQTESKNIDNTMTTPSQRSRA